MVRIVDAEHFLPGGDLPDDVPARRHGLRIARFIEYGGPLQPGQTRETLLECSCRPKHRSCSGLLWVRKTSEDRIEVYCVICRTLQYVISNWHDTLWADGPMEALDPTSPDE
jgi:hypothetical protein